MVPLVCITVVLICVPYWNDFIPLMQCAGNRRTEMSKSRKVRGVGWDVCALGNGQYALFCLTGPSVIALGVTSEFST